jgi:UDP-glucose 4-epimerase
VGDKDMRVLVTGGTGFLGRYLVSLLRDEGREVIVADSNVSSSMDQFLDVKELSQVMRSFEATRPDIVIHLAALTGAIGRGGGEESLSDPFNFLQNNSQGTLCVFEACRRFGIRRAIYMSSFSVYGETREPITENTPPVPTTPYGFSKLCGELVAQCYAINYGIRTLIFRAPLLCGKGQKETNALREFAKAAVQGQPIILFGQGEHVREWLHPLDVSDAILKGTRYLERITIPYEILVLGSEPVSMHSLAELVIREVGGGKIQYQEGGLKRFNQVTDTSRARNILGWKAMIPTDEIVREVVRDILSTETYSKPSLET